MQATSPSNRESVPEVSNRLGLDGIEFIEYSTSQPQALGQVLEAFGFRPVARHRSREVVLYRQGGMNLVVNANPDDARLSAMSKNQPVLSAVAFRVRDAAKAHERCLELGAWDSPSHAQAMELCIPAIHGPGASRYYFVDRHQNFSIYDIDFIPIPGVQTSVPNLLAMSYFGVVQYVDIDRTADWQYFYAQMFGFQSVPSQERFGVMPKGELLRSPCASFMWQLVEPHPDSRSSEAQEFLARVGIGVADVPAAVVGLRARGVEFFDLGPDKPSDKGALTKTSLGSIAFELVSKPTSQPASKA
jgi:4-hydroxyphenylpyruvate dioxygenase